MIENKISHCISAIRSSVSDAMLIYIKYGFKEKNLFKERYSPSSIAINKIINNIKDKRYLNTLYRKTSPSDSYELLQIFKIYKNKGVIGLIKYFNNDVCFPIIAPKREARKRVSRRFTSKKLSVSPLSNSIAISSDKYIGKDIISNGIALPISHISMDLDINTFSNYFNTQKIDQIIKEQPLENVYMEYDNIKSSEFFKPYIDSIDDHIFKPSIPIPEPAYIVKQTIEEENDDQDECYGEEYDDWDEEGEPNEDIKMDIQI